MRTSIVLAGVLTLVGAGSAFAGGGAGSDVVIDNYFGDNEQVFVIGEVSSSKKACVKARKVTVIGRDEQTGDTRSFGTDRTNKNNRFRVSEPIPFAEDFVYAKIEKVKKNGETTCKGDRSEEISTSG